MSIIPACRLSASDLARLGNNLAPARRKNRHRQLLPHWPGQSLGHVRAPEAGYRPQPQQPGVLAPVSRPEGILAC